MTLDDRGPHRRRSLRLTGYDYAQAGAYFLTICTNERTLLFGDVADGTVTLNDAGRLVEEEWLRTYAVRPNIDLDAYMVMPNHVHGVVINRQRTVSSSSQPVAAMQSPAQTIGAMVRGFKGACTRRLVAEYALAAPLWQRNYYEHIIRDDRDLDRIRDYIAQNPRRWSAQTVEERGLLPFSPIPGAP